MIALNEINEYAAEVAFNLPLSSDPLTGLTGHTFALGEVQIKLPGKAWANASLAKIVEKGYGRFAVRLTALQTTTPGDVFVRAVVSGTQTYFGGDVIGELGGDIAIGSLVGSVAFFLPDAMDPYNNPPLTGYDWSEGGTLTTTSRVRICLPDSIYVDAAVAQIEELGFGGFKVNLTASQTVKPGKVFVYAEVPGYQPFEGYATILGTGSSGGGVDPTPGPRPIPVPPTDSDVYTAGAYKDLIASAVDRLCEYSKSGNFSAGEFTDNVG